MLKKFLFGQIILDHFRTFVLHPRRDTDWPALIFCVMFPAVWSISQVVMGYKLTEQTVSTLITAASVFAGLLLNLLVLLYTVTIRLADINTSGAPNIVRAKKLLGETLANTSFSILVSVALVVVCLIFADNEIGRRTATEGAIYFLSPLLIITVLMILKRIHALLAFELRR